MINGIKQHGVVGKNGRIEIESELPEGTAVEIIVLVESAASAVPDMSDETHYLLSTEANRQQLLEAIESANAPENLVVILPEEWNEKYRVF
jgi:antitoxin YefM